MATKATTVWPLNENGELVAQLGDGTSNIASLLSNDLIPVDATTGKVVIKFPTNKASLLSKTASVAAISNALINPPLLIPAIWVASTAYKLGQVVSKGGAWYIGASTSGTSGATGPSGKGTAVISDGSFSWYFLSLPAITASDTQAPVVTYAASNPSGLTNIYDGKLGRSNYSVLGATYDGSHDDARFSQTFIGTGTGNSNDHTNNNGCYLCFDTDAPKIAIQSFYATALRIRVDDRYILPGATYSIDTGGSYTILDFSTTGGKKKRSIVIESWQGFGLYSINVDPLSKIWKPSTPDIHAAFITDSYGSGANPSPVLPNESFIGQVSKSLGWRDNWNFGIGGTGYVASGGTPGSTLTFEQHVSDLSQQVFDIVVISGGINDAGMAGIDIAALSLFKAVRASQPQALVIVTGVWPGQSGPSAIYTAAENSIKSAFNTWNDKYSAFIPVLSDTGGSWFNGTGNTTSVNATGNSDAYVSGDGVHLVISGQSYLAQRMTTAITEIIHNLSVK